MQKRRCMAMLVIVVAFASSCEDRSFFCEVTFNRSSSAPGEGPLSQPGELFITERQDRNAAQAACRTARESQAPPGYFTTCDCAERTPDAAPSAVSRGR
jgi:hypothetical protein